LQNTRFCKLNMFLVILVENEPKYINLRKGKMLRKHWLHGEYSSLGFIEAFHQWKLKMPLH